MLPGLGVGAEDISQQCASAFLEDPRQDISPLRAISSYGGDSLAAMELRNWFVRTLGPNVGVMETLVGASRG